jgi:putative endonuclease
VKDNWYVYIVECSDGSYYTGITKDVKRRVLEHNYSFKAAKYTRSRRPVNLLFRHTVSSQSAALKMEIKIKRMTKKMKINLIKSKKNEL